MLRDRLGWLLSGILIGILVMVSCDLVQPTAVPTSVQAAPGASQRPVAENPGTGPSTQPQPAIPNPQGADAYSDTVANVFNKGNPSVVRINVSGGQGESLGTGFIFDKQGHIITNHHVVAGGSGQVIVEFIDGEAAVGEVLGTDSDADLAVVRVTDIDPSILVPAELADSSLVRVGDLAIAIGNPFGENRTATAGIISAIRASKSEGGESYFSIPGVLQTDAAINPGNSGGPLFNSQGQVIGVNTFILDPSGRGANIGIGYSVPINLVKKVAPAIIQNGDYVHPFLGVGLAEVNSLAARQNGLPSKGVLVSEVFQGPSADAGIQQGMLIVAVDGQAVLTPGDVISFLEFNKRPGDTVRFTIRGNNGDQTIDVTVGERR